MGTVLLAEAVADLRLAFGLVLRRASHRVIFARSDTRVMALAARARFDVVVLSLPGSQGLRVCHQFRSNRIYALTPVLLMSADIHPNAVEAITAGAACYLTKPLANTDLLACVQQLMAGNPCRIPEQALLSLTAS